MDIQTVKLDRSNGKVEVRFTRPNGSSVESVVFQCGDEPSDAFKNAVKALDGDFSYIMEQKKGTTAEVSGVHFGSKGGRDTFQLLGGLRVESGFSSLNTPVLYEPGADLFEGANLTEAQVKRVRKVAAEAKKYVEGKRTEREPDGAEAEKEEAAAS